MKKTLLTALLLTTLSSAYAQRIVALSPDVADIAVALGAANEIVARDQTNQNPAL